MLETLMADTRARVGLLNLVPQGKGREGFALGKNIRFDKQRVKITYPPKCFTLTIERIHFSDCDVLNFKTRILQVVSENIGRVTQVVKITFS